MDLRVAPWLPCASWDDWTIKRWPNADSPHTVLIQGDDWWMSDLPMDLASEYELFAKASGSVLVTGLGLGIVVAELCRMPQVTSVYVVEIDYGIVEHVGTSLMRMFSDKLDIQRADAMTATFSLRYDWAWHDIWLSPTVEDIAKIEHRYAPFCKNQLSWWPRPPRRG